ncbi:MAG: hypothetical protein OEV42_12600 [Deltaproteobacteria bacterium]|nr:hypothetical protein [Deltaproteobacteria bacterium]
MRKSKVLVLFVTVMAFVLSGCNKEEGKEFYADGSLKGKGTVQADGKKEGKWKYFYGNGLMMSEGEYRDGHKVGKWKYWNKNGKLITVRNHNKEELHATEAAGAEEPTHKAEPAKTKKPEVEAPKADTHAAEAPEPVTEEAVAGKAESESEPSVPLAATMDEWKARAEKKH